MSLLSKWIESLTKQHLNYSIVDKKVSVFNDSLKVTDTYDTTDPSLFDAVLIISSESVIPTPVLEFMETTYKHYKPLALALSAPHSLNSLRVKWDDEGVYNLTDDTIESFMKGIAQGRFWNR